MSPRISGDEGVAGMAKEPISVTFPVIKPTVIPHLHFMAEEDCERIHRALKGLGTDVSTIIDILTRRSGEQRFQLLTTYKTMYGKDLIECLKSELRGHLECTVTALLRQPPALFDAMTLHDSLTTAATNDLKDDGRKPNPGTIIEILSSRTNTELIAIKDVYRFLYKSELELAVKTDAAGDFQRILVALLASGRDEGTQINRALAQADAKALYEAGPKKWGTDEATFISIFALRSLPHLKVTFDEFKRLTNTDIEKVIKSEMSGHFETAFLSIAKIAKNTPAYFAERLYTAMKGIGTDDRKLIRVLVTRCEKDLGSIKEEFLKMYGKSLESFITGDTSGDYRRILLALINC